MRRIRYTLTAGIVLSVLSTIGILSSLDIRGLFHKGKYLTIAIHNCPVEDSLRGGMTAFLAVNIPDAKQPDTRTSFTRLGMGTRYWRRYSTHPGPEGWHNKCERIVVETNREVTNIDLLFPLRRSPVFPEHFITIGEFSAIGPRSFEIYLPNRRDDIVTPYFGTDLRLDLGDLYVQINYRSPLRSISPSAKVFDFDIKAHFVRESGYEDISIESIDVAIESSRDLESSVVTRGEVGDAYVGGHSIPQDRRNLNPAEYRDVSAYFNSALGVPDIHGLRYFDFYSDDGAIRLRYVDGVVLQQLMLSVSSVVFGAAISAVLEAFLALAVLRAGKMSGSP